MAERYVPARALDNGDFKENADGSLDVKVLVLSGEEMYRDAQGDFVIDLESVALHKPTLIMDYNHDESEVIGHITNLRYENGGLWGDAHLFSARAGDRAEEVILRILGGTPYEISPTVSFGDSDAVVIDEGFSDEVNGRTVEGPATVFLYTPIRGVSICPYGTDKYTGITTLKMEKTGDRDMTEKSKNTPAHPDLEAMITEFGDADGLKYFRAGLSLDEARAEDYALLKAERAARLAAETSKLSDGGGEGGEGGGDGEGGDDNGEHNGDIQTAGNPGDEGGEGGGDEGGGEGGGGPQPGAGEGDGGEGEPEGAKTKKKKEEEKEGGGELKATLSAELDKLRAEIQSLKATLRRGEESPLDGSAAPKTEDKRPTVFRQADVLRAKGIE